MKRWLKQVFLISIVFNPFSSSFAKQNQRDSISFSGKIENAVKDFKNYIVLLNYNVNDGFIQAGGTEHLTQKTDTNGTFSFGLPDLGRPYKINLVIKNSEGLRLLSQSYYVEPGDSIFMDVNGPGGDSTIFSGFGSTKFDVIAKLKKHYYSGYYRELNRIGVSTPATDQSQLQGKLQTLIHLLKKYKSLKDGLLQASAISGEMRSIINFEFAGYMAEWTTRIIMLMDKNPLFFQQIAESHILNEAEVFDAPNQFSILCPMYLTSLSVRLALNIKMASNLENVNIVDFYNYIKRNYTGVVRERLITNCLFSKVTMSHFASFSPKCADSLLHDALKLAVIPYVRDGLEMEIQRLARINQKKVLRATFIGRDNKPFQLGSLGGKVYLIDSWFNGCFGCAGFHKTFKEKVYPEFKDNKNFVVLSLNIDRDKVRWEKGIASGLYTLADYINVSTGSWLDHPFLRYYNVKGSPWLMLVEADGTIAYQPNGTTAEKLIAKIRSALSRASSKSSK